MTISYISLFVLLFSVFKVTKCEIVFSRTHNQYLKDPSTYYSMLELICADGYSPQEHKVTTDDGYILTVHRVPNGKRRPKTLRSTKHYYYVHKNYHPDFEKCVKESRNETGTGVPVLFVHGLLMASDSWILQGPNSDLAYLLADLGYDVWFINVRGNYYSRKHKTLSTKDPKFWDFSFQEHAYYDVPATIDYILKETKQEKLFYVGISMGGTIFFAMASSRPEYNKKILGFIGLAPVVYNKYENASPKRRILFKTLFKLANELKKSNTIDLFPRSPFVTNFLRTFCIKGSPFLNFCYDVFVPFLGYNSKLLLKSKVHLYIGHVPAGTSLKNLLHYIQEFRNGSFRWYDYGKDKNMWIYGNPNPPYFPLWKITAPVALYYTQDDFFYDKKDQDLLISQLPNIVDVNVLKKFNHGDYVIAYNAKNLVYDRAISVMNILVQDYNLSKSNEIS